MYVMKKLDNNFSSFQDHILSLKIICLMLLDVFPNLEIRGVDYIDTNLLKGTEDEDLLEDDVLLLSEK